MEVSVQLHVPAALLPGQEPPAVFRQEASIFSCVPLRSERLWGPPSLLSNEYEGLFPWGESDRGLKLTAHLHLVPRSKCVELYLHSPIRLHGLVLS
jgi:hypothetical protein